jgi:uncharacterized membrane protein YhaH (DUF805 family)
VAAFLASLWRLGGRLGRAGYAGRLAVVLALFLLVALAAEYVFGLTLAEETDPGLFREAVPNAAVLLLFYWVLLALAVQRIRDMGFPPLPWIAALIALELLEYALFPRLFAARLPEPLETMTLPGGLLSIAALLWLLFWPGASPDADATASAPSSARPNPARRNDASPRRPA